ncbi:putative MFS family arabinose efflux permease [Kibdelosporangium banguiense]|uniref:MFS family arabinose efflux permease n=1 Tax=Kibdelosporangium banguiense TaxID=1365924 RepID=A0ABS4TAC8_9PSEU|nr:MFS transporter [Kibdelosporangium banguiense]MBP2321375.1 putative MFS family arabinose efflux permease [Kibdelosporangium banguiense]
MVAATFRGTLAVGEFRAIWLAELQSVFGDQLARIALSVLVFERTNSASLPALTYALTYLPDLIAGPLLGGLADRYPRRAVMVTADVSRAVLVALMAIPGTPLAVLAALVVAVQLLNAPFTAAQAAILPNVLTDDRYEIGQSIRQVSGQAGQLIGFAGGGVMIGLLGAHRALAVNAISFAISALIIRFGVRPRQAAGTTERNEPALHRLKAGVRTIWRDPRLRSLVTLAWLAGFVIVPEGLAVPYAAEIGGGPVTAGFLLAAHPAGIVIGASIWSRWVPADLRLRLVGLLALFAIVPLLGYAFKPGLIITMALLIISGACAAYQITAAATFMRLVPDAERGQAFGLAGAGLIAVQGIGLLTGAVLVAVAGSASLTVAGIAAAGVVSAVPAALAWHRARQAQPLSS